jgi:hypothetical protein
MAKKYNGIDMGDYLNSKKEQEAFKWCIDNSIYITPKAKSTTEWWINIEINKKSSVSPIAYKKVEIWKQMYKYYMYYYDKYKK